MIRGLAVLRALLPIGPSLSIYFFLLTLDKEIFLDWVFITQNKRAYMYVGKKSCFCVSHKHVPTSM